MGIGPVEAVPPALQAAGLKLKDMELIELNEAFAAQSLAVMRTLDIDPERVNVNGGAIALGHPLGCTGAKLSVQLFGDMKRSGGTYRSDENTSELQSLMRRSYAVFCLKKTP